MDYKSKTLAELESALAVIGNERNALREAALEITKEIDRRASEAKVTKMLEGLTDEDKAKLKDSL